jgi:cbb3-type cytochrome oxidase cytochrome c subunit
MPYNIEESRIFKVQITIEPYDNLTTKNKKVYIKEGFYPWHS